MTKLTETTLRKLLPETEQAEIRDDEIRGLMVRGNRSGASWGLRYTDNDGERRRHTLGRWPGVSVVDARNAARIVFGRLALGESLERATDKVTLDDAFYRAAAVRTHLARSEEAFGMLRTGLAPLLNKNVTKITKADIFKCTDEVRKTRQPTADAILRNAKPIWRWFADREICADVLRDVRVPQTNIRERVLSLPEIGKVYDATFAMPYPFGPLFRVLCLSAQRRTEVAAMRKAELQLDEGLWVLPAERSKNRTEWIIPLPDTAVEILRDSLLLSPPESPFVFSTTGHSPVSGFSKAKTRLDELCGVENWRLHDIRRTVVTGLADDGFPPASVDLLLNHVGSSTTSRVARIYNRSNMLGPRREMIVAWETKLLNSTKSEQPWAKSKVALRAV